jgi:hypothetical protein
MQVCKALVVVLPLMLASCVAVPVAPAPAPYPYYSGYYGAPVYVQQQPYYGGIYYHSGYWR